MEIIKNFLNEIIEHAREFFSWLGFSDLGGMGNIYTAIARWVFIILTLFILAKAIASLLAHRSAPEVFAYFNINGEKTIPISHWENTVGRSKSCDLVVDDPAVSRTQGALTRDDFGNWKFMDLGSSNGTMINNHVLKKNDFEIASNS